LLQSDHSPEALRQLEKAGQIDTRVSATAAVRDKSNMVLGSLLFESKQYGPAQLAFDRVRLDWTVFEPRAAEHRVGRGHRT